MRSVDTEVSKLELFKNAANRVNGIRIYFWIAIEPHAYIHIHIISPVYLVNTYIYILSFQGKISFYLHSRWEAKQSKLYFYIFYVVDFFGFEIVNVTLYCVFLDF